MQQREASRFASTDLSVVQIKELLSASFAELLQGLEAEPAPDFSDVKVEETLGESAALVSDEGDSSLLEAGIPIETKDEAGDLKKVNLNLEVTAGGFEPSNPLTELQIPDRTAEPIVIGTEGLAVTPVGAGETVGARRFGEKDILFPEINEDTDLLVSPLAGGVELFDQLRSPGSPEPCNSPLSYPMGQRSFQTAALAAPTWLSTAKSLPMWPHQPPWTRRAP